MKKIKIIVLLICLLTFFTSCENVYIKKENTLNYKYEMIATWINYFEIAEIVKECKTQSQFDDSIINILSKLKEFKINTIFLQVRALDDALYKSDICMVSDFCKNESNELKFDVLETFIRLCNDENIDLHAWINPYRIRNDNNIDKIKINSYAYSILQKNTGDERIIVTDNSIYYNPAYPENQNYILDCIREIIKNYNVDGIHIDDYFYPSTLKKIDEKIYNQYVNDGGVLSISDYRQNCINTLVSSIYRIVSDNNIIFSISPCGDIDKNLNELYADVEHWSKNIGYVDYIIPQLYYGYENDYMPYDDVFSDWIKLKNNSNKVIIGLPLYKIGKTDYYAGKGKYEWIENNDIILKQILHSEKFNIDGFAFYSSSYLYKTSTDENIISERNAILKHIKENWNNQET